MNRVLPGLVLAVALGSLAEAEEGLIHGDCDLSASQPLRAGYLGDSPNMDVVAGPEHENGLVCIAIPDEDAFGGLVDADDIVIRQTKRPPSWDGRWEMFNAAIEIRNGESGWIEVEGYAEYGADDPVRVANGSVHVGSFAGRISLDPDDLYYVGVAFDGENTKPLDQAEDHECTVEMRRVGNWLWVDDNGKCGGANVSFTGVYRQTS